MTVNMLYDIWGINMVMLIVKYIYVTWAYDIVIVKYILSLWHMGI